MLFRDYAKSCLSHMDLDWVLSCREPNYLSMSISRQYRNLVLSEWMKRDEYETGFLDMEDIFDMTRGMTRLGYDWSLDTGDRERMRQELGHWAVVKGADGIEFISLRDFCLWAEHGMHYISGEYSMQAVPEEELTAQMRYLYLSMDPLRAALAHFLLDAGLPLRGPALFSGSKSNYTMGIPPDTDTETDYTDTDSDDNCSGDGADGGIAIGAPDSVSSTAPQPVHVHHITTTVLELLDVGVDYFADPNNHAPERLVPRPPAKSVWAQIGLPQVLARVKRMRDMWVSACARVKTPLLPQPHMPIWVRNADTGLTRAVGPPNQMLAGGTCLPWEGEVEPMLRVLHRERSGGGEGWSYRRSVEAATALHVSKHDSGVSFRSLCLFIEHPVGARTWCGGQGEE